MINKEQTRNILKLKNKGFIGINEKIQKNEGVTSEELNKLGGKFYNKS